MRFLAICTCAGVLALASEARADDLDDLYAQANPQPPKVVEPLRIDSIWYGWQTLLADVPLVTALASAPEWARFDGYGWLVAANVVAAFATTPIIHALNGNRRSAGISIAARLAAPMLFGLAGFAIGMTQPCACTSAPCICVIDSGGLTGMFVGVAAGFGFAAFVDALGLAWKPKPKSHVVSWSVSPMALHGGGGISAGGTF